MKFTLKRFESLTRDILKIGGSLVAVYPAANAYVTVAGAVCALVGVVWSQMANRPDNASSDVPSGSKEDNANG